MGAVNVGTGFDHNQLWWEPREGAWVAADKRCGGYVRISYIDFFAVCYKARQGEAWALSANNSI